MNGVAYFSDFGEHHRCAAAHQQVRVVADSGVSGNAGERVAATHCMPTTITSPPKFGFSAILWMVRIGTHGGRYINRYATAVEVVQVDHAVDAQVFRQQVAFDNFNHVVLNVCHAVPLVVIPNRFWCPRCRRRCGNLQRCNLPAAAAAPALWSPEAGVLSSGAFDSVTVDSSIQLPLATSRTV